MFVLPCWSRLFRVCPGPALWCKSQRLSFFCFCSRPPGSCADWGEGRAEAGRSPTSSLHVAELSPLLPANDIRGGGRRSSHPSQYSTVPTTVWGGIAPRSSKPAAAPVNLYRSTVTLGGKSGEILTIFSQKNPHSTLSVMCTILATIQPSQLSQTRERDGIYEKFSRSTPRQKKQAEQR